MVRTSDLVFGCSVVRAYHPYIFRESSVTTFKLFKIQSQSLSIDVVLVEMPTAVKLHSNMAADDKPSVSSVRASSPYPMVTKLVMYNVDDAGTEFSAENSQKNYLLRIFALISTFRPIGDHNYNSIR